MSEVQKIEQFLAAYQRSDHAAMAKLYDQQATFEDIAFRLRGRRDIHFMWHMICHNGITVEVNEPPTQSEGWVLTKITDKYIFSDTKRNVVNPVTCRFKFKDGLIVDHRDECDPIEWANQAFGGMKGWLVGRLGFLRRRAASRKLKSFQERFPDSIHAGEKRK